MRPNDTSHSIFVHTSDNQLLPALVAIHSLRTHGEVPGTWPIRLLRLEGSCIDQRRDGQPIRARGTLIWNHQHHFAFHFLRRSVPEALDFLGRALVIDPDVFAVGPVAPLFEGDMGGRGVLARHVPGGYLGDNRPYVSSGVMLLDCAKLRHWRWRKEVEDLFSLKIDYWDTLELKTEPADIVGDLEEPWNSMDNLTPETRLLHNTRVATQPWLTGLPMPDYIYDPSYGNVSLLTRWWRRLRGRPIRRHIAHPDDNQESMFFRLLADCMNRELLPRSFVENQIKAGRLRRDAFRVLERAGLSDRAAARSPAYPSLLDEFGIKHPEGSSN